MKNNKNHFNIYVNVEEIRINLNEEQKHEEELNINLLFLHETSYRNWIRKKLVNPCNVCELAKYTLFSIMGINSKQQYQLQT